MKNTNDSFNFRDFYSKRDSNFFDKIEDIISEYQLTSRDVLKHYNVFTQRRDIVQTLAYYDLFSLIKEKPGSIVEAGVFMGNGLFTWAKLMETFCPGDRGRLVYGFDNFKGYNKKYSLNEKKSIDYIERNVGKFKIDAKFVSRMIELHNNDNLIPGVERVKLYAGDLSKTIPEFLKSEEGVRISLLLIDLNLYYPTKLILNRLYDLVIPGGIIALRGYGVRPWEGESKAVDEFLKKYSITNIFKFSFSPYPAIYFIKK